LGAKYEKSAFENLEIRSDRVRIPIEREGDGQIQIVVNTKGNIGSAHEIIASNKYVPEPKLPATVIQ